MNILTVQQEHTKFTQKDRLDNPNRLTLLSQFIHEI